MRRHNDTRPISKTERYPSSRGDKGGTALTTGIEKSVCSIKSPAEKGKNIRGGGGLCRTILQIALFRTSGARWRRCAKTLEQILTRAKRGLTDGERMEWEATDKAYRA